MIEISLGKMVLLALIALIVLGPEKLPGAARTAGALLRRVRSGWDNVRSEVERELEIEEIKRTAREAATRAETLQNEMKETARQVHEPMADAVMMAKAPVTATTEPASVEIASAAPANAETPATPSEDLAGMQSELPLEPTLPTDRNEDTHGRA
jgi:sec-independent protein translocase protein TatB